MTKRAEPVYGWGIKMRGKLDLLSISDSRDDLVAVINRPAGQSVVHIKISEVAPKKRRRGDAERTPGGETPPST